MGLLKQLNFIKTAQKTESTFTSLLGGDFRLVEYKEPHEYVTMYWEAYQASDVKKTNSLNGSIFEIIIETLFYREGLIPFYTQAKAAFVPNVNYDMLLYSHDEPVSISLKTSLRERYKQADLEAMALKYVHRRAKCYLMTNDKTEAENVRRKIAEGDVLGLDDVCYCFSSELDDRIMKLKQKKFIQSETVDTVKGNMIEHKEAQMNLGF